LIGGREKIRHRSRLQGAALGSSLGRLESPKDFASHIRAIAGREPNEPGILLGLRQRGDEPLHILVWCWRGLSRAPLGCRGDQVTIDP